MSLKSEAVVNRFICHFKKLSVIVFYLSGKGIWGSMVALDQAVQHAVLTSTTSGGTPEALEASHNLDLALQRHRTAFINLLRNSPKNANERYGVMLHAHMSAH